MILSFKEYLQEVSNCPDGKKYCPKCQMCVEKTCAEKKMARESKGDEAKSQMLQKKQLMINRQKLQLQMKAVNKKKQTDMYMQEAYGGKGSSRQARLKSIHPPTAQAAIKNIPDDQSDRGSGNKAKKRMQEAAWTKKEGQNKEGGLNEKGRKSYERENPGSDLKAPSKKKGNKRRASFCARMKGMKKKLTSAKTARDPDSRINKSLRAWNC